MSLYVLANDWFLMMTSDVVPPDPVTVEIVEDCQARFRLSVLLYMLSVVRLPSWRVESSSARPVVESRTICRIKSDLSWRSGGSEYYRENIQVRKGIMRT